MRFRGEVQGVGFRWTSQLVADRVGCTGWVRNEDDGTVSSELQGTGHAVCRVLAGLRDQFADARSSYEFLRRMGLGFSVASCERMPLSSASSQPDLEVRV